jgi:hypothetical protein
VSDFPQTYMITPVTGSSVYDSATELLTSFSPTHAGPLEEESDDGAERFSDLPSYSFCLIQAVNYTDAGFYEYMNYAAYTDDDIIESFKFVELSEAPYSPYDPELPEDAEVDEVDTEEDESEEMGTEEEEEYAEEEESEEMGTEEEEEGASGGGGEGY